MTITYPLKAGSFHNWTDEDGTSFLSLKLFEYIKM